jgi:hypothetical protein
MTGERQGQLGNNPDSFPVARHCATGRSDGQRDYYEVLGVPRGG